MTNFLLEIAERFETQILPTPVYYNKQIGIYYIDIRAWPNGTYWNDWGGYYNNFRGTQIDLYFGDFLTRVSSMESLLSIPNSQFLDNGIVYLNIPRHPWLFPDYSTSFEEVRPFLSSALNPDNPSFNIVREEQAPVKLEMPNFSVKLSDNIAGITLNQGFSVSLANNDGFFDDDDRMNLFNTPAYLKKSIVYNPQYDDFKLIRMGLIENTSTTFDRVQINVSDRFKALEEPVLNTVEQDDFSNIAIDDSGLNKPIPLIYGTKRIRLTRLNETTYLTGENVISVISVFDRNGNVILSNPALNGNGTITTNLEAHEALVRGNQNNRIGQVIMDIMSRTNILYNQYNFNLAEFDSYAASSFRINLAINSGNIKRAIESALRNDVAFFVQQSDGKFTIRRYGESYTVRTIQASTLTKNPEKSYNNAHGNYFSSFIINYGFTNDSDGVSFLFNERERQAESMYRRRRTLTFDSDLTNESDARELALLLSDRFTTMRQTLKIYTGVDTSNFELLDTVSLDLNINNRRFNKISRYMIKEINPAQDILTLEELEN